MSAYTSIYTTDTSCVYQFVNKITGIKYIGFHKSVWNVLNGKYKTSSQHKFFKKDIKENYNNYYLEILTTGNRADMAILEDKMLREIAETDRKHLYYNKIFFNLGISRDLEGNLVYRDTRGEKHPNFGKTHSEQHCKNISIGRKGQSLSEEHCKKISIARKGKPLSKEHCKKISKALKGRTLSEERCKNISISKKGKPLSKEHCKKISIGKKGKPLSKEHCKKLGNESTGKSFYHLMLSDNKKLCVKTKDLLKIQYFTEVLGMVKGRGKQGFKTIPLLQYCRDNNLPTFEEWNVSYPFNC